MKNLITGFVVLVSISSTLHSQNIDQNVWSQTQIERSRFKSEVMNVVLATEIFDFVYKDSVVYFSTNDLIVDKVHYNLQKLGARVEIVDSIEAARMNQFVVLADFTLDWTKPFSVRIQLSVTPNFTLTWGLEKHNEKWVVLGYALFAD
ncbi:MAG: hypothetical protein J5I53_08970 [Bradyrhizobiaceae bacterium]|nr:hypothetical protein [Bradyrhizobiaceae bacterium]